MRRRSVRHHATNAVLDPSVRKTVDQLWDLIWSSGITNPLAVVDYLAGLFVVARTLSPDRPRARRAAPPPDVARMTAAMASLGLSTPDPALWQDAALLARTTALVARLTPGDRNRDLLGDCFEHVLRRLSTAGHFGQFRTPRHLVRFLVAAVDPRAGEAVLDPACGTAGFLIAAHEHRGAPGGRYLGDECDWTMARIATANMVLHGITGADIRRRDAFADVSPEADVILANPPFAGSIDEGRRRAFGSRATKSEVLFVELMLRRLLPGGRAGVVVPAGLLTSPTRAALAVRRALVHEHGLRAVIELPAGVFRPYTDVRSALLLWQATGAPDEVLMARVRADGFSLDDKRTAGGKSDLDALLPHVRGDAGRGELRPALGGWVRRAAFGEACVLSPGRHLAGAAVQARPERSLEAVLTDAAASAQRLGALLATIAERSR